MKQWRRRTVSYWGTLAALAILSGVLAFLQYRWTGEIGRAEQERVRASLDQSLLRLSRDFSWEILSACRALQPSPDEIEQAGRERSYQERYRRWSQSRQEADLFRAIGIAIPQGSDVRLMLLNRSSGEFELSDWPSAWQGLREQFQARLRGPDRRGPLSPEDSTLIELPRFIRLPGGPGHPMSQEQEWLVLDLNVDYARSVLLPELLSRHLGHGGDGEYDVEVFWRDDPSKVIYQSNRSSKSRISPNQDASIDLFENGMFRLPPRGGREGRRGGPPPGAPGFRFDEERRGPIMRRPPMGEGSMGRWTLAVRSAAGSLNALVDRTRRRNLAISGGIILLLLAAVAVLLGFSRQAEKLAELQMNFVAGVSHELRTPLTVIRTAAFNLKRKITSDPQQAERYSDLIQEESAKLTALVDQVLRFASASSGSLVRTVAPLEIQKIIDEELQASRSGVPDSGYVIDKRVAPDLPTVLGDEVALHHAIRNLLENAAKYGSNGSNWIGVYASRTVKNGTPAVEIRVADKGPGVPPEEQRQIFQPFFRGKRAVDDQIHGTGLGLTLVKKIVEAHGGTVAVKSEPMKGAEFIVTLPASAAPLKS